MKILYSIMLVIFSLSQFLFAGDFDDRYDKTDWEAFSRNLVKAISMDNEGVQLAAMQHVVTYHENLDAGAAVFDLIRIYRLHDNEKVRQLAVVTLHYIDDSWAKDYLKRNLRFEENSTIRRQIIECLNEDGNLASSEVESLNLVADK